MKNISKFKPKFLTTTLVVVFLCLTLGIAVAAGESGNVEVLVKFTDADYSAEGFAEEYGVEYVSTIPAIGVHVFRVNGDVEKLDGLPGIEFWEVNGTYEIFDVPNDPFFSGQQNLPQIQAVEGWQFSKGCPDVVIAVLDTGIAQRHDDLVGKVIHHKNFSNSTWPYDRHGHGTHVAGIASAVTDNLLGIAGVNWYSSLMSVKVMNDHGTGTWDWIASGIVYAADNGADVINMSLGGRSDSLAVRQACDYAYENNVVVVASAGNDPSWVGYPAKHDSVIAVGAVRPDDTRAGFSAIGDEVELTAPGTEIYGTYHNHTYSRKSGTSMAAPHVAALAALVIAMNEELTAEEVRALMIEGVDDLGPPGRDREYGYGRINLYKTLELVKPPKTEPILTEGMIIIDDEGFCLDFLRNDIVTARKRINEALARTQPGPIYVKINDIFMEVRSNHILNDDEIEEVVMNMIGYWDGNGEFISF